MCTQINIPWRNQHLIGSIHFPDFYLDKSNVSYPLIIICHGFTSSRIGVDRLFVKSANQLTAEGCIVVRFDYSGCGESEGNYGNSGLDELIEQTINVIEFCSGIDKVDSNNITLLGHSLGGAAALLTAVRDNRIKQLILWSAVANPYEDIVKIVGVNNLRNFDKSTSIDYLGYTFTEKYFNSLSKFQPLEEIKEFRGDTLVIHGTDDKDIPVHYCQTYEKEFLLRTHGSCTKQIIQGANHTYSCSAHFKELIDTTKKWVNDKIMNEQLV